GASAYHCQDHDFPNCTSTAHFFAPPVLLGTGWPPLEPVGYAALGAPTLDGKNGPLTCGRPCLERISMARSIGIWMFPAASLPVWLSQSSSEPRKMPRSCSSSYCRRGAVNVRLR